MSEEAGKYKYRIVFPGGEIIYQPLEGIISDPIKKHTIKLAPQRTFSIVSGLHNYKSGLESDFNPVCLTLYSNHDCNLDCTYCYIPQKDTYPKEFINPATVESAARLVIENCKKRNQPFVVGFHGGNEPLLHPGKLEKYLALCDSVAKENNVNFLSFCTTNGVIPEETARWAAKTFYGITCSWDGLPEIHDTFRKNRANESTSRCVEKSVRIFSKIKEKSGAFLIRCTVTSISVSKMVEIVRYFTDFGVKLIEFYPVFSNKDRTYSDELIPDPHAFVYNFLKVRKVGLALGINILFSGSRLKDLHNRYCMVLQDNLTVTPDNYITNCYHHTQNYDKQDNLFFYGKYNLKTNSLEIDHSKLKEIIHKYTPEINECLHCFNRFHCSHGCPDLCPFKENFKTSLKPDCINEKWIGLSAVLEKAGYLKDFDSETEFVEFFRDITWSEID